jgi:hypothetical protein
LSIAAFPWTSLDHAGIHYAIASGALTSGVGYAIWYTALKGLKATHAATVQLSVPVIAALGGVMFLDERHSAAGDRRRGDSWRYCARGAWPSAGPIGAFGRCKRAYARSAPPVLNGIFR